MDIVGIEFDRDNLDEDVSVTLSRREWLTVITAQSVALGLLCDGVPREAFHVVAAECDAILTDLFPTLGHHAIEGMQDIIAATIK